MQARKSFDILSLFLYAPVFLIFICLSHVGDNGEPFGLALLFALCRAGLNPFSCALCYTLSALFYGNLPLCGIYLTQAVLLSGVFFICKNTRQTFPYPQNAGGLVFPLLFLTAGLILFLFLSPFAAYPLPFAPDFLQTPLAQKGVIAALVFLLSAVFSVATHALVHKFLKCRLRIEEILFAACLYLLMGVGFCKFFGFNAYLGTAFFFLLLFCHVTKDAGGVVFAFVLGLPCAFLGGTDIARFFVYGVAVVLFCHTGRVGVVFALLCAVFAYAYADGVFFGQTTYLIETLLSALLPCLLFLCLPKGLIRKLENELIFYREKHLSRIAVNLGRAAVGGQLFELSALFREIQTTFSALQSDKAEKSARTFIVNTVWQEHCHTCPLFKVCQSRGVKKDMHTLIEVGCIKGRASLIDLPESMARLCERQSDLLFAVNRQLNDYRRFMTEAENAASGRALLAAQAQGVSEILKNVALEQSEPLQMYTQTEKNLSVALLKAGIVCTELMVYGQDTERTLSLITFGKSDVKKIARIASLTLGEELMISKRIPLSREKCCLIFRCNPCFDAAFGVASKTKDGENACGDTHSVIKIDERRFLVALADGMGSGEYAKKISACTLSLLESFYRAKMPPELILSTVNKLLSFNKEEAFTCVDVAVVDLDTGHADVVKIGSPTAFILSEKSLQILESSSLPLGILDSIHPDTASYPLKENDVLLFLSDGVSGAFGSLPDLIEFLRHAPISNPQHLADHVLNAALQKYGGVAKDDMTALAVRLFKPFTEHEKNSA